MTAAFDTAQAGRDVSEQPQALLINGWELRPYQIPAAACWSGRLAPASSPHA
jgi:hypothetical protein